MGAGGEHYLEGNTLAVAASPFPSSAPFTLSPRPPAETPGGAAGLLRGTHVQRISRAPAPPSPVAAAPAASVGGGAQKVTGLKFLILFEAFPEPRQHRQRSAAPAGCPEGARPGRGGTAGPRAQRRHSPASLGATFPRPPAAGERSRAARRACPGAVPHARGPARLRLPTEAPRRARQHGSS